MLSLHTPAHAERLGCPFLPPSAFVSSSAAKTLTLEVMFLGQSSVAELSPEDNYVLQLPTAQLAQIRREEQLHNPGLRPASGYNLVLAAPEVRILPGRTTSQNYSCQKSGSPVISDPFITFPKA